MMALLKSRKSAVLDFAELRERMVLDQITRRGVRDKSVLAAMRTVPRHLFVPHGLEHEAYTDGPLPIGHEQTISQPYVVASMTEHLQLNHNSRVLEIGTGSGYQAAVLAEIAKEIYTVEIVPELLTATTELFKRLHYRNILAKVGDGSLGWPEHAPFDAIILTAAAPRIPRPLIAQLAMGGRMVLPLKGFAPDSQELVQVVRTEEGLEQTSLYSVRFVPMTGAVEA